MSGFVTDVAERIAAVHVKIRVSPPIVAIIIGGTPGRGRVGARRRWVVEYIGNIYTEIDTLAFHEFDVFAQSHVKAPASRTGDLIVIEVASSPGWGFLEDYHTRIACESECAEILVAAGSNALLAW